MHLGCWAVYKNIQTLSHQVEGNLSLRRREMHPTKRCACLMLLVVTAVLINYVQAGFCAFLPNTRCNLPGTKTCCPNGVDLLICAENSTIQYEHCEENGGGKCQLMGGISRCVYSPTYNFVRNNHRSFRL